MAGPDFQISIDEILGDKPWVKLPIDDLETGNVQARQSDTDVKDDDKLVGAIRRTKGIIHPIVVKDLKTDPKKYEIIIGQRRTGAYHILKNEDSRYNEIKAYVVERDLTDNEIRIISFVENDARKDMDKSDYVNVIEYFYVKFGRVLKYCAKALGISTTAVKKYLLEARLSDKVKECIKNKDFTIDTAMKSLKALGDDEESVNDDMLIEVARELKKVKPATRKKAVKKMQRDPQMSVKDATREAASTTTLPIEITDDTMTRLEEYKVEKKKDSTAEAAVDAMEAEIFRGQEEI